MVDDLHYTMVNNIPYPSEPPLAQDLQQDPCLQAHELLQAQQSSSSGSSHPSPPAGPPPGHSTGKPGAGLATGGQSTRVEMGASYQAKLNLPLEQRFSDLPEEDQQLAATAAL